MTSWLEVYDSLGITKEDLRLFYMLSREDDYKVCTIAQASDLVEFERHGTPNHCKVMKEAIQAGENGVILDMYDMLDMHRQMFDWGGDFRECDVLIPDSSHLFPRYQMVPILMKHFFEDLVWWLTESKEDAYVILAHLHLEYERIHGMRDGNGRLGRILLNSWAAFLNLPHIRITPDDRNEYLTYLEDKDEEGLALLFMACSV